jgi:hypothetical protein
MYDDDKPDLDALEHVGVLGMKWGHRKTGTSSQIYRARGNVSKQRSGIKRQESKVNNASSDKSHNVEKVKLNKLRADYLRNPDRVISARMTIGEKAAALIFAGPVGLAGIAATSARSRVIENKQDKRKAFD